MNTRGAAHAARLALELELVKLVTDPARRRAVLVLLASWLRARAERGRRAPPAAFVDELNAPWRDWELLEEAADALERRA